MSTVIFRGLAGGLDWNSGQELYFGYMRLGCKSYYTVKKVIRNSDGCTPGT